MTKKWVAFVSVLLLSGTAALADSWSGNFQTLDTDGSGTISRGEWQAGSGKLDLGTFAPTFVEMDQDGSNSVDSDEWAHAQNIVKAHSTACKHAEGSWCPCQNHPEKPECH